MKISIITLFPEMISGFLEHSIIKRAKEKKLVEIEIINIRDFANDSYGSVDDRPYGGGAGMVMRVDILSAAIHKVVGQKISIDKKSCKVILTSAKGACFSQKKALELSKLDHIAILAGHYEGVDERIMGDIDEEISVGDYVLTGGELPASIIVDAVVRLLPGVLKKETATQEESFSEVGIDELIFAVGETKELLNLRNSNIKKVRLLEYPHYTRPFDHKGNKIPPELFTGDHQKIRIYRLKQSYLETIKNRPDLLDIYTK